MSTLDLDSCLDSARRIAHEAGETILRFYRAELTVKSKGGDPRDLVTDADLAADACIRTALAEVFPDHAILSEERFQPGDTLAEQVPTWLVDPVDGTSNFAHGFPLFAVSLALYYQGQGHVSVIHAPVVGWTFAAARGRGATLNGQPLRVSARATLATALGGCDWPRPMPLRRRALAAYSALAEHVHTVRSMGSAALSLSAVAAGWLDVYYNFSLEPWDTAGGALLVQEAGGRLGGLDGTPWHLGTRAILATNGALHEAARACLGPYLLDGAA